VGKGKEVNSAESSCHLRGLINEEEAEDEGPHSNGDSHGAANHVNEDDEKLKTFVIKEKD
jgi:hypothetical protein